MAGWRYLAQNALTGQWLHKDLELADVEIEDEISGPGSITATVQPQDHGLVDASGQPLFQEWSTILYAEADGEIRKAGILQHSEFDENAQSWVMEAPGFSSYPNGQPFDGEIKMFRADPFEVVRKIWASLQAHPNGNLGMVVDSTVCPVTVGDPDPGKKPTVLTNYAWTVLNPDGSTTSGTGKPPDPGPSPQKGTKPTRLPGEDDTTYNARVALWEATYAAAIDVYQSRKDAFDGYAGDLKDLQARWSADKKAFAAYELYWWEAPDCGQEIERLATEVPFEYWETHAWVPGSDNVSHRLHLAYPRRGRRRRDLRYVPGENVMVIPRLIRDGAGFANEVVGLGKGEGKKMLRTTVSEPDGRLRRAAANPAKDVGSVARLRSLSEDKHRIARYMSAYTEIEVIEHPNAPLGALELGDEILVDISLGNIQEAIWCKVLRIRYRPDDRNRMTITVARSEQTGAA